MDQNHKDLPILSYVLSKLNPNSHPPLPPQLQQTLLTQLPYLSHPKVLASLAQAIPDITQITKSVRLEEMHEEYEKQLREAEDRLVEVYGSVVSELEKGFKEEEVCDEVVGILKEAEGGVVVERVELCGRQLRFLPEAFGMLRGLLVLNLSHNQLEVLPDSISGLQKLEELDISSNLLVSLPGSIGLLLNLRVLNVSGNKLSSLPDSIARCSEAFAEYAKEIGGLMNRLLSLISQGLGLDKGCLRKRIGDNPRLRAQANFYPSCPDPELTLGLAVHTDLNALTVLQQSAGVTGLQVIKDGKWVAVDPIPNAFVINLGDQIQVLSNGRFKSVHHRAVTDKTHPRVSLAMFYGPNTEDVIGPVEDLIDGEHPPVYRSYRYAEFLEKFYSQEGTRRMVKELFELPK